MFKFLQSLFKKKSVENNSAYMNKSFEYSSYDIALPDTQDKTNEYGEKYESHQLEENVHSAEFIVENSKKIIENKYIKVLEENKVYSEGTYIVGQNGLLPGLYYAWDNYHVLVAQNDLFSSGRWECDDGYIQLSAEKRVVIESGKITSVDNLCFTYNKSDYLFPGHTYLVGKEVPNGRYKFTFDEMYINEDYNSTKKCIFHRIMEEENNTSYKVEAYSGLAETDSKTNYIVVNNGKAVLIEEGVFYPKDGPREHYYHMRWKEKKRIESLRNEMEEKNPHEKIGEFVSYYFAINEPIAEIVILEYFAKLAKVEKLNNFLSDDFSTNYKIEISMSLIDAQCVLYFMFMNKYITPPATFGTILADIFTAFNNPDLITHRENAFEKSYANYIKQNPNATNEDLNRFRSKMELYREHATDVYNVVEIIKSRLSSDICDVMKKYCEIYPFKTIENASYYVSYVSAQYIKQYFGIKCPKYLYYHMFNNRNNYELEYRKILLNLKEQGLIKSRWKNEFSLYMLVKSYFSSAIYQYHADWLGKQSLDIYIPEYKIGIEYQGKQHYEEVELFNGANGLMDTQQRDKIKKEKCCESMRNDVGYNDVLARSTVFFIKFYIKRNS